MNNNNVTDTNTIAHEFNSFFTNIARKVRSSIPRCNKTYNSFLPARIRNSIFFTPIEDHEIVKLIQGIDCNKAVGPSSIPNKILSILPKEIAKILASIFNLSLTTGKFLTLLKTAKVIPVYKNKGDDQITSNYRPIALLSNIDKIFEKLVHKRLVSFLDREKVLYDQQFGFRNKHSTLHNLIVLSEEIRKNIDKGNFSCSIFLDLAKAFDVIDHEILLTKLNHYGIRGIANDWIRSYLTDRKQFVHYKGQQSSLQHIKYGVLQGSVLGPLLFINYISDIQNALKYSKSFIFADDTSISYSDKNIKSIRKRLNIDLKLLSGWLSANKIALNINKTEVILFKHHKKLVNYDLKLKLYGKRLYLTNKTKYLGLLIDENLNWKFHLEQLAVKLRKVNGILSKLRHFLTTVTLKSIYYALFYSNLIYGLQVWGQDLNSNCRIKKLQKTAIRLMSFSKPTDHTEPLFKGLSIQTINETVFQHNILLVYKTLNKITPVAIQNALKLLPITTSTRASSNGLLKRFKIRTTKYGLRSINYQSVIHWNTLQSKQNRNLLSMSQTELKKVIMEYLSP